jgi:hypothetical protein
MSAGVVFSALLCVAGAVAAGAATQAAEDDGVRRDLELLSRRTVLFGHQSVGANVIEGVQELAAREGIPLRVAQADPAAEPAATFLHAFVAENGDPERKLRSFAQALQAWPAGGPDLALVKLCYVDFRADTDVRALFARYAAAVAELSARYPGTTFVHVTAPLTTVQGGPKALAKRLLRRPPAGVAENARREAYNALLREAYAGRAPVFDLALVESTRPDGRRETVSWGGHAVPVLVAAYTDDGGHLNRVGRLRAARALVEALAAAPLRRAPGGER